MQPQTIGRYQIIKELGHGGMSIVYLARDPQTKREVAVKVLPSHFLHDPTFRSRFDQEAEVVARLEHSAVVPVYDYGREQEQPFLVMRHMSGGSLAERLAQGPLSTDEVVGILKRVGAAVDYAHRKGIVHRDLKPGNILFDESGEAHVADFGIARMLEAEEGKGETATGVLIGTPDYMSPEQAMGKKVDGRSDVYSLGAMAFEMLTGQKLFSGETKMEVVYKQAHFPAPDICKVRPDLPGAVGAVMGKTLVKERDGRYDTGTSLIAALETAFHTAPPVLSAPLPLAKPPTPIDNSPDKTRQIDETAEPSPPAPQRRVIPGAGGPIEEVVPPLSKLKAWLKQHQRLVIGLIGLSLITPVLLWVVRENNLPEVVIPTASATVTITITAVPTQPLPATSATHTPTPPFTATATPGPSTATPALTRTSSPTPDVSATATETPSRTPTRRATATATLAVPSSTPTLEPTTPVPDTAVPPTTTPPPTITDTPPTITDTPEPKPTTPTSTPVVLPTDTATPFNPTNTIVISTNTPIIPTNTPFTP